ncbi:type VII secretion integral membrane protein EccD [Amycolatopsis marina]|uniref:Type VII secretion integral membrane protein EccD n=1 Tax=Amycolatopsis marina TaxID=490629 RepID=A0A1I1AGX9_9PSEU|nr:type VII secretion integral membrane protein EccD [Amycolatopsis marina]SFB35748.1 type VII secretion integral membrane protein EccD [Amycolatopsis marina]
MTTTGLVRVTIAAPHRSIDLALPENSSVAEILPGLLRHAGEHTADDGVADGGWLLRRADGKPLDLGRSLGAHRVRDGEVLHLALRRTEWPELEYDDLVDAIATGSGRIGRGWSPLHTRLGGLVCGGLVIALGLGAVLRAGPPWHAAGLWALGLAALLVLAGVGLARSMGDSGAGAVPAGLALPFAFTGGALVFAGDWPISALGAPQLLFGSAAMVLVAVLGYLGVVAHAALFTGAATVGLLGVIAAWLTTSDSLDGHESAAVVAGFLLAFSPMFAPLSLRLSRVPMPVLPRTTADLVRDDPLPSRKAVYGAVVRADGLLTGMLLGSALVVVVCQVLLISTGSTSATVLVLVLTLGFLLRARLYPILWQRVPLLAAGFAGVACLVLGPLLRSPGTVLLLGGPVTIAVGACVLAAGLVHSRRAPTPFLGRYAEIAEVIVVLAVVPVACAVLDLYAYVRGLGG